jgi:phosphatidylinositol-4,5-bisphosphate 3-kinase
LERAISNKQFGNCFFWYLRSEFDEPKAKNRFSIILEIFLTNSRIQVQCLIKQQSCFKKLKRAVEKGEGMAHEKCKAVIVESLEQNINDFADFYNPINLYEKSKILRSKMCTVFKSKTRPIRTICENVDRFGSDINFIFKSGDDLRQDIFTLQILRVMDMVWKSYGLDFQMTNYGCLSTGPNTGLIELVNAETIATIQRQHGLRGSFKLVLLTWLKDKNKNDKLKNAIKNFTFSAVGYCVATYILGVADRHSDNIMIKENGLMFHIDFGHILGNFKRKFGIKRENVPFILTHDFVDIINNGEKGKATDNFLTFKNTCLMVVFWRELIRDG